MPCRRIPKYRHYKPKALGMVVIDGHAHYLGRFDSPESWERYHRLIAELHAGRLPNVAHTTLPVSDVGFTINELILAYARFADGYYVKDGCPTVEPTNIRLVLRLVRRLYGTTPAHPFGPLAEARSTAGSGESSGCSSGGLRGAGDVERLRGPPDRLRAP